MRKRWEQGWEGSRKIANKDCHCEKARETWSQTASLNKEINV